MTMRTIGRFICACLIASAIPAQAQTAAVLRVITFNGGWNLPLWAAQRQGFFEANGVAVQLSYTPSSEALVTGLFDGRYDIALATIDNFIAYQEGQGEVKISGEPDLFSFMGGDGGFLSVVASPGVKSFADLKGKTLSVDAMTNGLAFVLRELLERDLLAGKHAATLLRTPFELLARNRGFNQLATAESLGAYEGTVGAARRLWARSHEDALIGFLRGYRAGVEWLYDRANREVAEAMLVANIRDMTPALAKQSYELLLADKGGLAREVALDIDGIRTVLQLRSKFGSPQKTLNDPMKYIDLSYYDKAFGKR
jgi:ABC-type nitrate/sulfonate/bicarbonate transport system substrate-binding protein